MNGEDSMKSETENSHKEHYENCVGCNSKFTEKGRIVCRAGLVPKKKSGKLCPCSECLVKVTCDTICDKLVGEKSPYRKYNFEDRKESYLHTIMGYIK